MNTNLLPLIFLPAGIACVLAIVDLFRRKDWNGLAMACLCAFTQGFNLHTMFSVPLGTQIPTWVWQVNVWMTAFIVPVAFRFVCQTVGHKVNNAGFFLMIGLAILLVAMPSTTIHLGETTHDRIMFGGNTHLITIFQNGTEVVKLNFIFILNMLQALITIAYIPFFAYSMQKYQLHVRKPALFLFGWWLSAVIFFIIVAILPYSVWHNNIWITCFFVIYAILALGLYLPIVLRFYDHAMMTQEKEIVTEGMDMFISQHHKLAEQLRQLLDQEKAYLQPGLTIDGIATQLNTNRTYITRTMKAEFNTTFSAYIGDKRVQYAQELMLSTDLKQEEISERSGFNSVDAFARTFKRIVGETPERWRKQEKNQSSSNVNESESCQSGKTSRK